MPRFPHVGFTARRDGLSPDQLAILPIILVDLQTRCGARTLHHGDSVGGDEQGAHAARRLGYRIVGHPPEKRILRAFFENDETRDPQPYLTRDRAIVSECDVVLGFPRTDSWRPYSGTWYTINKACFRGRARLVIGPTGRVLDSVGVGGLWEPLPEGRAG